MTRKIEIPRTRIKFEASFGPIRFYYHTIELQTEQQTGYYDVRDDRHSAVKMELDEYK